MSKCVIKPLGLKERTPQGSSWGLRQEKDCWFIEEEVTSRLGLKDEQVAGVGRAVSGAAVRGQSQEATWVSEELARGWSSGRPGQMRGRVGTPSLASDMPAHIANF